ncbi:FAD-dependent oxidoreductase [Lysobacter solisilvae (ex Woo and Kim 2022)]|uniref:FAD-dependent oxidoreductase n=1 Tax=Agrilutibacter terrestris TaxID=2865112 RepID=A0A7H0FUX8_9GAMM|nr:FAD-dependent oxidoreductase [Lysobacter terrestris]QNP39844.1 FAD-dependent oxidoreductase [Lysobacter terrestris]
MSRRDPIDVAIVGAGVVGAAAALALARDGWRVALVEAREPAPWRAEQPDLRVYAFAPDNTALLDELGVWKAIADARVQPYRGMRVWDAAGGDALRFEADAFGRRELGWIVENGLLVDRLWQALPGAGVRVLCPAQLVALEQDADQATLELGDGMRLRARLVLAADGGDSKLRALAGIDTYTHDYGQNGLVAFVDHELPHEAACWQRFLPTGPIAFLPFGGDGRRSSIVWTLPETEAVRLQQVDDATFLRELEHAFAGTLGALTGVSKRVAFPLRRQLAQAHVAGRVAVIGDAAHVVHPLAGQGVNLGLRDVAALRGVLQRQQATGRDPGAAAPLARWARERRSENAVAAYSFDGINRLFSNDDLLATLARGPLLGLVGKLPPLRHAFWRRAAGL